MRHLVAAVLAFVMFMTPAQAGSIEHIHANKHAVVISNAHYKPLYYDVTVHYFKRGIQEKVVWQRVWPQHGNAKVPVRLSHYSKAVVSVDRGYGTSLMNVFNKTLRKYMNNYVYYRRFANWREAMNWAVK